MAHCCHHVCEYANNHIIVETGSNGSRFSRTWKKSRTSIRIHLRRKSSSASFISPIHFRWIGYCRNQQEKVSRVIIWVHGAWWLASEKMFFSFFHCSRCVSYGPFYYKILTAWLSTFLPWDPSNMDKHFFISASCGSSSVRKKGERKKSR